MYAELGIQPSALAVARHYTELLAQVFQPLGFVMDTQDVDQAGDVEALGMRVLVTNTLMKSAQDRRQVGEGGTHFMSFWAIVPVKPLVLGKSRLAEVLTPGEREDLNRRLLVHTLETLSAVSEIENVLVVSRDQAVLALARDHGARTVRESGAPQLNVALARATLVAQNSATRGVLIVPADLAVDHPGRYSHDAGALH